MVGNDRCPTDRGEVRDIARAFFRGLGEGLAACALSMGGPVLPVAGSRPQQDADRPEPRLQAPPEGHPEQYCDAPMTEAELWLWAQLADLRRPPADPGA